jgi:DNA repair protein RadC
MARRLLGVLSMLDLNLVLPLSARASLGPLVPLEELLVPDMARPAPSPSLSPGTASPGTIAPAGERDKLPSDSSASSSAAVPLLARERLWRHGAGRVSDEELVGILLGTGMRGRPVWSVASDVVRAAGGLPALSRATPQELIHTAGIGECRAVQLVAAFELGRRAMFEGSQAPRIQAPEDCARLLIPRLVGATQERFYAVGLDARNHLIDAVEVARGALTEVMVYPREVFRPLIRMAASTTILAHNHPSGDPAPSTADLELTVRLRDVGDVVGIPVMDHIVIAGHRYRSIMEWAGTTL